MDRVRLLYVEDDATQREQLAAALRSRSFDVSSAASAAEGLLWLDEQRADVVLCDLNMPGLDGLALMERAKQRTPQLPFVILTAHGSIDLAVQAIKAGAYQFLCKPVDLAQLDAHLRQAAAGGKLEQKAQRAASLHALLIESVPDIIYSLSPEGRFLSYSAAAAQILGYGTGELIGRSVFEIVHPDDRERIAQRLADSVRARDTSTQTIEFRMLGKDGESRDFEIRRRLIFDGDRIVRHDGIARDVTERKRLTRSLKRANDELRQTAAHFRAVFDAAQNALLLVDGQGTVRAANRALRELFGLEPGAVEGSPFAEVLKSVAGTFVAPADFERLAQRLIAEPDPARRELADHHELFARALLSAHHAGHSITSFSTPVQDAAGAASARLWIFSDITKLKQADEQLHKIVEASPVPLIVTRLQDGQILFANEHLGALVDIPPEQLVGRPSPDFYFDPADRAHVVQQLQRDGYLKNHEVRLKRPDGSGFWVIFSLVTAEIAGDSVIIGGLYDISERKASEEALSWERNFVSAILDTAGVLVVVLDRDGKIVRTNEAFQRTSGYAVNEVFGKQYWDLFVPPDEKEGVQRVFQRLKAGDFPNTHENYWLTKAGARRLISWSNTALLDAAGVVEYIVATGIDVTEQRQAERKLRLYRELFINASDAFVIFDTEGRIVERNPAHRSFSGYTDDELYGQPLEAFFGAEQGALLRRAIAEQAAHRGELTIHTKSGAQRHVDLAIFPICDEDGRLLCYASMGRNITDRKRAEAALRDSEETFRSISAAAQDAIIMLDNDGRITVWNQAAEKIFGWSSAEALGADAHALLAPTRYEEGFESGFAAFRSSGQGPVVGETVSLAAQRRDGAEIPIELSVSAVERKGQWHAIGIARDITERRRAEQALKEKQAQLVQAEKMASLGMLVAGIAHEINTPIGAVNSVHNTLVRSAEKLRGTLERDFPEQYRSNRRLKSILDAIDSANQVIQTGTERVTNIVRRLKSFARLDEAELKEVDLHEGLEDTLTIIHHEIKHKAEVVRAYGKLPPIRCYPGPINQVFLNLLINASQAIVDRGQITITTAVHADTVEVQIADDGIGIRPEHLKRIFDPGFTTKGVGVGTGLGLSICYQIVHDHHGEIRVASEVGRGTTFTVVLPRRLDELLGEEFRG